MSISPERVQGYRVCSVQALKREGKEAGDVWCNLLLSQEETLRYLHENREDKPRNQRLAFSWTGGGSETGMATLGNGLAAMRKPNVWLASIP